jgi:hypothetical protein
MNREQCLIEITKELQVYNKVSLHTLGNVADIIDKYANSQISKIKIACRHNWKSVEPNGSSTTFICTKCGIED